MRPKKSLGQHFLISQEVAHRIVSAIRQTHVVVEVGPGKGILTHLLEDIADRLILVEKDDQLAASLKKQYAQSGRVEVVHADFLDVSFSEIIGDDAFTIVGNFPYNISSQIVFKMLGHKHQVPELVGMFQLEMAQRILAGPGSKTYSVIGVLTQAAYSGSMVLEVPPEFFDPPPRVHSGVIRLERKADVRIPCDETFFRTVVKSAFAQRRKMLRNSLKGVIPPDAMTDQELFERRPEQVPLETFYVLARLAEEHRNT